MTAAKRHDDYESTDYEYHARQVEEVQMRTETDHRWQAVSSLMDETRTAIRSAISAADLEAGVATTLDRELGHLMHTVHHRLLGVLEGQEAEQWVPSAMQPTIDIVEAAVRVAVREAWLLGRQQTDAD